MAPLINLPWILAFARTTLSGNRGWIVDTTTPGSIHLSSTQRIQQLRLKLNLTPVVLQRRPIDQERVLDPLAQRADLGELQVDVVLGQHAGDAVEQPRAVTRRHRQHPALCPLVRPQLHPRRHRERLDPP